MTLKLITLNIEGDKHLGIVITFLKKEKADVVCLQEVFEEDFSVFKKNLKMEGEFFPMCCVGKEHFRTKAGVVGVAYLTCLKHTPIEWHYYWGDRTIPKHTHATPYSKDLVFAVSTVEKDGEKYTIGTTHFTWTPHGQANEQQRRDFKSLMKRVKRYDELILCGDFNAPRGREMFTAFTRHFKDHVPTEVDSTLDPHFHNAKSLRYVVDGIFSTHHYSVKVRVVDGLSDHKALVGIVNRA